MPQGRKLEAVTNAELSVVIQGALSEKNLVDTANACVHWRRIFPSAQIILSISVTDVLVQPQVQESVLDELELVPAHEHNGVLRVAARRIRESCDLIVLSEGALPLPPIKTDSKINNVNLQIAAAKAGLVHVARPYLLRIRSDMVFLDRSFLAFYEANAVLPRDPGASSFAQRVMISPYFTLNPFTMERLPFHFSDWFHFGLTEDVRAIWNVEEMSLAEATHHVVHPAPKGANRLERKFRLRIAVEQHINFSALSDRHQGLRLDYLTDRHSAERSIEILLNDFLVCDMTQVPVVFEKYNRTFRDPMMEQLCITYPQWRAMLDLVPGTSFAQHYAGAARRASVEIAIREEPAMRSIRLARGVWRPFRRRLAEIWSLVSNRHD